MKMPKKKLSDLVFQRIDPPDYKAEVTLEDLVAVLVRRLGLKRKRSEANHEKLLLEFLKFKKNDIPLPLEEISKILGVSQSQTYEELRKWRTLGLIEFVKHRTSTGEMKGYMLTKSTMNRLLDKVDSAFKAFMRETRRIAKDFDDAYALHIAREIRDMKKEN